MSIYLRFQIFFTTHSTVAELKKTRYSIQMRRLLSPIILILLVTQSFASTFQILKNRSPGQLESKDPTQAPVWINIPAGTKGDVIAKKKFRDGSWAYEFEVSEVGASGSSALVEGSRFWFPCQDAQCPGLVEFRTKGNRITSTPKLDDHFKSKKEASVRNTVQRATPDGCAVTLDDKNAQMISTQVNCLKKATTPEVPTGEVADPIFNEMVHYLNLLKPNQKSTNAQVARYTLEFGQQKGIPPLFLLSLCKAESSFNPNAKSTFVSKDKKGRATVGHAYGVCQLLTSTATSHSSDGPVTPADLRDIRTNLDLATDEIHDIMHMQTVKIPVTRNGRAMLNKRGLPTYTYMEISGKHPQQIPESAILTTDVPNYLDILEAYNCGRYCLAKIKGGGMKVPRQTINYAYSILHNLQKYEDLFAQARFPTTENIN